MRAWFLFSIFVAATACKSPPVDPPATKQEPQTIEALSIQYANATGLPKGGPELMKGRKVLLVSVEQRVPQPQKTIVQDGGGNACYATKAEEVGLVVVARARNEAPRIDEHRVRMFDRTWQIDAIAVPEGKIAASWTRTTVAQPGSVELGVRTLGSPRLGGEDHYGRFPKAEIDVDCASIQAGIVPGAQGDAASP